MSHPSNRRPWLALTGATVASRAGASAIRAAGKKESDELEVPAAEDLMREHGILRRALLVYSEAAAPPSAG